MNMNDAWREDMKKLIIAVIMMMAVVLSGCSQDTADDSETITVFAAASLNGALDELIEMYEESH